MLDRSSKFSEESAFHDIVHRVVDHHDYNVHQHERDPHLPVKRSLICKEGTADENRQDIGDLKTDHIDDHKIHMLRPALSISLIQAHPPFAENLYADACEVVSFTKKHDIREIMTRTEATITTAQKT